MTRTTLKARIFAAGAWCFFATMPQLTGQNATDGTTPPAIAPGTPSGSYVLSNLETINYYTGKLNLLIPLHSAEGRGKAGYTLSLPIQRNWTIERVLVPGGSTVSVSGNSHDAKRHHVALVRGGSVLSAGSNGVPFRYRRSHLMPR